MRKSNGFLGLIGVILLVFAGVGLILTRGAGAADKFYVILHVVAGVLALVAYLSAGADNLREFLGERSTKYGTSTIMASIFFLGILIALNYLSVRHNRRFDLTESNVYSLSPQSTNVVKGLTSELKLVAFVEGGASPALRDLFESYKYASPSVAYEIVDPDRRPELAEQYKITAFNSVVVALGESSTIVTQPNEETITNAIIKVTRTSQLTVCITEGHGEPDIDAVEDPGGLSQLKEALTNENYQVKKILLASVESVPADCNVLLAVGTNRPFLEHEVNAINTYLRNGGHGLFFLPPEKSPELPALIAQWGVKVGDDIVVDQVVRIFQGPALGLAPLVNTYDAEHEITREMKEGQRTNFPMARSVGKAAEEKTGSKVVELAKTSTSSWAEADVAGIFERREAKLDTTDRPGPVPVMAAVETDLKELGIADGGTSRLVVVGSAEFAENRNLGGTFYNRDLAMNAVGWLVGQSDLVSLRPKGMRASRVSFTEGEASIIFYLSVLIIPELLLLAGIAVWWRRE